MPKCISPIVTLRLWVKSWNKIKSVFYFFDFYLLSLLLASTTAAIEYLYCREVRQIEIYSLALAFFIQLRFIFLGEFGFFILSLLLNLIFDNPLFQWRSSIRVIVCRRDGCIDQYSTIRFEPLPLSGKQWSLLCSDSWSGYARQSYSLLLRCNC